MGRKYCQQIRVAKETFEVHTPNELKFDPEYQRNLKESWATEIGEKFDRKQFGVPTLSRRLTGELFVIDGQHRIIGAIKAGLGGQDFLCKVMTGLTQAEEADLFYKLQEEIAPVAAYDAYRARLTAQHDVIVEINNIVLNAGLRVGRAPGVDVVKAVKALEWAHVRCGNLPNTLHVLREWSKKIGQSKKVEQDPLAYDGDIIRWVARFLREYKTVDQKILIKKLTDFVHPAGVERFIGTVKNDKKVYHLSIVEAAMGVLFTAYNKHSKNKKLLRSDRIRLEDQDQDKN